MSLVSSPLFKSAKYGAVTSFIDVLDIIAHHIERKESLQINNTTMRGDPLPGKTKFLLIEFHDGKRTFLAEGGTLESPLNCFGDIKLPPNAKPLQPVTFVIPSIGRSTLLRTLQSIAATQSKMWRVIVVFDGCKAPVAITEWISQNNWKDNITLVEIPKVGFQNCAGQVRNAGIKHVNTEWMAFADDDDVITSDYMICLQSEIYRHPCAEVVVFRMLHTNMVLPSRADIILHEVGISFAMKTHLATKESHWFQPSTQEDFQLLNKMQKQGKTIHVSNHITYIVRPPSVS